MITALIGHRGVEKTALLKRLEILFSRREDVILSDLDFEIKNRAGRSIASIFEKGKAEFRRFERETSAKLIESVPGRSRAVTAGTDG